MDSNQEEIVKALRKVGAKVFITSGVGNGFPDLIVGFSHETYLLEVKDGAKQPSQRKLTADEQFFIDNWRGRPVAVVGTVAEALNAIGIVGEWE